MFLNNNRILLKFLEKFTKVYDREVLVNVRQNFVFPDIMSDRFCKIICSPGHVTKVWLL